MKKFFRTLSVFTLAAIVGLSACKDDDSDSCENGSFEMTFDGDEFTGESFNNTLVIGQDAGVPGKRMDIRATDSQGTEWIITFSDMSSGTDGNGVTTEDEYVPVDGVTSQTDNAFFFTRIDSDDMSTMFIDGELDITSCDAKKKQVSGTFIIYDGESDISGSFTNMCYRIIKD